MFASSHAPPLTPTTTPIYPIAALILQCSPPSDNQQTLSHTIMLVIEPPKHCAIRAPMGERYSAPLHYYCRSPPTTLKLHLDAHLWRFFSARSALRRRLARSAQSSSGMGGGFLPFYGFALGSASLRSATLAPTILRLSFDLTSLPRFAVYGASRALGLKRLPFRHPLSPSQGVNMFCNVLALQNRLLFLRSWHCKTLSREKCRI